VPGSVAVITLGCARNEVDSEELAGRLADQGWTLVEDPAQADAVLVNTCGFVDVAKKDSIDTLLASTDLKSAGGVQAVVAVGCLSERYGKSLAQELPEVDAVLGFDDYPAIAQRLDDVLAGRTLTPHVPKDRRTLLPISPVDRPSAQASSTGWRPPVLRRRLDGSPVAPVKLASGCDRRCSFCAIPSFRGSFVSRSPQDICDEITWLGSQDVREVVLVSENSTSYGKDFGDLRALESLLPQIDDLGVLTRLRVAYLQPAEIRPGIITGIIRTPVVANAFDISFQHASPTVLRRMRRFGGIADFLTLIEQIRSLDPQAGIRSNVIVGFPGETDDDLQILIDFLTQAELDAVGVFGYSDEEGTEAFTFEDKLPTDVINERVNRIQQLVDSLMVQRAEDRIGHFGEVLIEMHDDDEDLGPIAVGRAAHQNPDDAATMIADPDGILAVGSLVPVRFDSVRGFDLLATPR
jgi:ribosomal protein S12 methylthiotransferase